VNSFVKLWPILVIFGTQYQERTCHLFVACRVGRSSGDVADKEVMSLSDLSIGDVRRGYVVSAGSVGVLVRSTVVVIVVVVVVVVAAAAVDVLVRLASQPMVGSCIKPSKHAFVIFIGKRPGEIGHFLLL